VDIHVLLCVPLRRPNAMTGETWSNDVEGGGLADFESHPIHNDHLLQIDPGMDDPGPSKDTLSSRPRAEHWERGMVVAWP